MSVFWITAAIVLLDQLTKLAVKGSPWSWLPFKGMPLNTSRGGIGEIIRITFVENPGIAFSINIPSLKVAFSLFSIVVSILIAWYIWYKRAVMPTSERIALAIILGGALGNMIDRVFYGVFFGEQPIFYGRVVDWIDFGYRHNVFPVFNIADSAVTCGGILFVLLMLLKKPEHSAISTESKLAG